MKKSALILATVFCSSSGFVHHHSRSPILIKAEKSKDVFPISNFARERNDILSFGKTVTNAAMVLGLQASIAYADADVLDAPVVESPTFTTTESGLQYLDTKIGDGPSPLPGDTVRVHYTGWLEGFESEKKFDSSYDRRSPLVFKVGLTSSSANNFSLSKN